MSNWGFYLNDLAREGVIGYGAPEYVLGQPSAYPQYDLAPIAAQPNQDIFDKQTTANPNKTPTWKKLLFGAITIGGLVFAGSKIKSLKNFSLKNIFKKNPAPPNTNTSSFITKSKNWITTQYKNVAGKLKGCFNKPPNP